MIGMISASGLTGEHVRFALVENGVRPTDGLACPIDDRLFDEAEALCESRDWPFIQLPAVHNGDGVDRLLECDALVVVTDGNDYACSEVLRRAESLGIPIYKRLAIWEQQTLW